VLPPGQPGWAGTRSVLPPGQPVWASTRSVLPPGQPRWAGTRSVKNTHDPLSPLHFHRHYETVYLLSVFSIFMV